MDRPNRSGEPDGPDERNGPDGPDFLDGSDQLGKQDGEVGPDLLDRLDGPEGPDRPHCSAGLNTSEGCLVSQLGGGLVILEIQVPPGIHCSSS